MRTSPLFSSMSVESAAARGSAGASYHIRWVPYQRLRSQREAVRVARSSEMQRRMRRVKRFMRLVRQRRRIRGIGRERLAGHSRSECSGRRGSGGDGGAGGGGGGPAVRREYRGAGLGGRGGWTRRWLNAR